MLRILIIFAAFGALEAQQTVAPTQEPLGSPRGENTGNYNITNSFETGYRWSLVGGDLGMYRSDVNYRNGIRLLGSNLTVNSKDGHGKYFDEIVLNTTGLGNDPYQAVMLRVQKNALYRYDMTWRLDEFYNPGLTVSDGLHLMDTRRRLQDHELTLFPQSRLRFDLGYSRNDQTGPALSSVQLFDNRSSAYPFFSDVRREWNEYRVGVTALFAGFVLTVRHSWEFYKDDTANTFNGSESSTTPFDSTALQTFNRSEPYHGRNPGWLGNLHTDHKLWAVNARMTYVAGSRDFAMNEVETGLSRFGGAANRQVLMSGTAERPVMAGDFSASLFPTKNLTLVNNTTVHNTRIEGGSYLTQFDNGTGQATTLNFNFLGVRTIANATDINYRMRNWLGFYAGYVYSDREIRLEEAFVFPQIAGTAASNLYTSDSHLNSGRLGIRIRPVKALTVNVDGEVGHASRVLASISDRDYHTLNGRIQYRTKKLQLAAQYRQLYNENAPLNLLSFSSRSRTASASASYAAREWLSFDASYTKLHLDTVGALQFFAGTTFSQLQHGYNSIYVSNIHAANLGVRISAARRADLFLGYSITKDTGDGRGTQVAAGVTDPVQAQLSAWQTFPLTYQSPLARVSVRITPKLRWNAGYQFYGYGEQFHLFDHSQNYHAHTGFTSLLWAF
jgi:hypothetical protein